MRDQLQSVVSMSTTVFESFVRHGLSILIDIVFTIYAGPMIRIDHNILPLTILVDATNRQNVRPTITLLSCTGIFIELDTMRLVQDNLLC